MTLPPLIRYSGVDSRGAGRTGAESTLASQLVERLYRAGWRSLHVTRGDAEVGGIAHVEGRRTWWAER